MLARYVFFKSVMFIFLLSTILYVCYDSHILETTIASKSNSTSQFLLYSYGDLDQQLCKRTIDWRRKSHLESSEMLLCPENEEIVSVAGGGRTGNLMWAYASVLAIAQQTGLQPYIPSCLKASLAKTFEGLTLSDFRDIVHCPVKINTFVTSVKDWKVNPQSIILPQYIVYPRDIIPFTPNIWQEFMFKKNIRNSAQETLRKITKNLPVKNYTFVGVHVRRADYKDYLKSKYKASLAGPQFFLNAMAYFSNKYDDTLFMYISDDPKWCSQQFAEINNTFVVSNPKNNPALDMAIMAACNHTIYDYGTFGEWGAILAKGEAVCFDIIQNSKEGSLQYNESWHLMS